jgi:hypothetical protein
MDEKGFLIGLIGRSKRIFSRRQWEKKDDQTSRRDDMNPKRLRSREIRTRVVLGNGAAVGVGDGCRLERLLASVQGFAMIQPKHPSSTPERR